MSKNNSRSRIVVENNRVEQAGGRDYLVVPAVPVREQVLNRRYLPANELEFAEIWNGTSLTIRHPKLNSGSVNVPEPDVAVIGKFYNAAWNEEENKLVGEYWIDINDAMRYVEGQYILNAIYSGRVLETSTGYWCADEWEKGEFGGREYDAIQHNLRPDHIAILVDAIGACSVEDGCGVNRNSLLFTLYQNEVQENGGPGSGDFGHSGREGQVGGAAPGAKGQKPKVGKKALNKDITAFYVVSKSKAGSLEDGIKTRTSLMSASKAQALFKKMQDGELEPVIYQVRLKKGFAYDSIGTDTITVHGVPGSSVSTISWDSLQKKKSETFRNNSLPCGTCPDMATNEESMMKKIEMVRDEFYKTFHVEYDAPPTPYFVDIFPDYCIAAEEGQLYKVGYKETDDGIEFDKRDSWTKTVASTQYVDQNEKVITIVGDANKNKPKIYVGAFNPRKGVPSVTIGSAKVSSQNFKEKLMSKIKFGAKDLLAKLREQGVQVNMDNDTTLDGINLELETGDEQVEGTLQTAPAAQPAFNETEIAAIKKLATMDFSGFIKVAESLPAVVEMAQNAEAEKAARKAGLVAMIKANTDNTFSDEELNSMGVPVLTKINARLNIDYSGFGGGTPYVASNDGDDELLVAPDTLAFLTEKES